MKIQLFITADVPDEAPEGLEARAVAQVQKALSLTWPLIPWTVETQEEALRRAMVEAPDWSAVEARVMAWDLGQGMGSPGTPTGRYRKD